MTKSYLFEVKMSCGGCSGAITRVLNKQKEAEKVKDFTVSLPKQLVLVESDTLSLDDVNDIIAKTQKTIVNKKEVIQGWKLPEAEGEKVEWDAVPTPVVM
ncbi:hypothetical protein BJ508DRAFT_415602 [Ascobolus immersus RN42]|uniref:HMA domain-containing protein n=1 Tax=Ascobolus immersus RN42 TaxID=1160509 RepID=A0A3N4I1F0_ASCIM|nr:hypothetical protein BJ508DRAFT_415602 [Ascobolus immersus RN42]